ncbi:MAG: S9 family peptidase [Gammaproteobacteria bacterium]|nr:prolyl oligopeptidase family serine peptidase [Gammaproteobacteria bacterium]NNC98245.1 S9 family peptidase [Gammaproteobacteria bacterium]NNM14316.1 S9 family peptidase [Gammaproteobacteria bacterium]
MAKVKTLASNLLSEADLQALEDSDPYLWLEDVDGEKALNWVKARNKESLDYLEAIPGFKELNKKNLEVYDSDERIAYPSIRGDYVYNFWKDDEHIRGIYRRTTLAEYLKSDDPDWKTVLDIDALAESENKNWVYKGSSCLYPEYTRCILNLSIGGSDAVVRREYDLNTQSFVENGFVTKESKGAIAWLDKDTVMVGVDFGPESMTDSGYPKLSKLWKRGTPLTDAKTLFTGQQEDVGIWGYVINVPEGSYPFIRRSSTFYTGETHYYHNDKTTKLDLPKDADFNGIFKEQMLVELKSDWEVGGQVLKQGSLVSIGFENFLAGKRNFTVLYEPSERTSVAGFSTTRDHLLLSVLNNVRSELYKYEYAHGSWTNSKVDTPDLGNLSVVATNDTANDYFYTYTGFLNPNTLYYVDNNGKQRKVRSLPDFFDAGKYQVQQFEVTSKDGTKVPYFMVARKDLELNGKNPTVMYGYGGFEVSLRPSYSATIGIDWLDQGGTYVLTNIRGGGEFGPKWHHAALKEKRPRAYEDFIAIAEDLIDRKITSPQHLGIRGGSNGGLLVGAIYTMRPDLFNAVVCAVPLLDMKRYNKLLAGASWMAEYGDPDIPEQWDYIKNYSPYHNLEKNREYPKVFFYTSTKDDRVHPGHARKMVALMEEYGHPNYYYENIEGGHAGSTNNEQAAYISALTYSYFKDQLMPDSQKQAAK